MAEKMSLDDEIQRLKTKVAYLEQENFGKLSALENPKGSFAFCFSVLDFFDH